MPRPTLVLVIPERGTLYEATSFVSVPYLVPKLAAAADGDPATTA